MTDIISENYFDIDTSTLRMSTKKGYLYFYMPQHPLAVQNGMVALHRHIASVHQKKWLTFGEAVIFINGDRSDLQPENLKIVPHDKIFEELSLFSRTKKIELICQTCNAPFYVFPSVASRRYHCSPKCSQKAQICFHVKAEELAKLVWEMPTTHIAAIYGVSDKAVAKRCKKYGIKKPGRGYWAKQYARRKDILLEEDREIVKNSNPPRIKIDSRNKG